MLPVASPAQSGEKSTTYGATFSQKQDAAMSAEARQNNAR